MNRPTTTSVLEGYLAALLHETDDEQEARQESELDTRAVSSPAHLSAERLSEERLSEERLSEEPFQKQTRGVSGASVAEHAPDPQRFEANNPAASVTDSPMHYHASATGHDDRAKREPLLAAETRLPEAQTAVQVDIAVLEEHKRQQLQRLLSSQALSQAAPNDTVVTTPSKVTAQEALQALVERERAAALEQQVLQSASAKAKVQEQQVQESVNLAAPAPADSTPEPALEAPPELMAWGDFGRPIWAENAFDVLLFEVSGLALAVPLVALGQIVPMANKLTKLQGQSDWFMGILASNAGDIRTINTALFVMPERYQSSFVDSAKYVVTIDGLPWGLAVDKVNQPITLQPHDVKWRSERSKRPWLAGTVKSHMCALIDIPQMAMLLDKLERPRRA